MSLAPLSVPVYRQQQNTYYSPCSAEDMCGICAAHVRGAKKNLRCLIQKPTESAFNVPLKTALGLVMDGLAEFVNGGMAIRLKFSRLAHLRDRSCKIDEALLIAYVEGKRWARRALALWDGKALSDYVNWTPEQMAASQQQIQCFT